MRTFDKACNSQVLRSISSLLFVLQIEEVRLYDFLVSSFLVDEISLFNSPSRYST